MRPNIPTQLFLDSGDPEDTKQALELLGFLDGQTTNPSLVANKLKEDDPDVTFTEAELLSEYRTIIKDIADLIPEGSISIEVYADEKTTAEQMIEQAKEMKSWTPHAHIKLPVIPEGLKAAEVLAKDGTKLNMTLVFSQEQAAAVYAATEGSEKGSVYVSPFIGRLDDKGKNGMDLIHNIYKMFAERGGDGHVKSLAASVRSYEHFMASLYYRADIITCGFDVLREWADTGMLGPLLDYEYEKGNLVDIPYQELDIEQDWREFDIQNDLTDAGLKKFADSWNALISS